MSELDNKNGWTSWSNYVLKELEKLGEICDSLANEINNLNVELTKISGVKHSIHDIKEWKSNIEDSVNISDLKNIKDFYIDNKDISKTTDSIKEAMKKLDDAIYDYKKFKVKVYTLAGVISFLFATALTLVKLFI